VELLAGRYELVEVLGRGGHGAVHRAIQRPLGREVAVKMLLAEIVNAEGARERFAREAGLVKRLEHPNTVRLYDFGTTDAGMPFMVFELLRGRALDEEIAAAPLDAFRTARVATQVLKSLMEAHAIGIVHRDIKPSNVLLVDYAGERDFVKVLDFGVARVQGAATPGTPMTSPMQPQITHDGQIVGTPAYMAPEQVSGGAVGPSADLYALGLLMIEAMTGAPVYGSPSVAAVLSQQLSPAPVPIPPLVAASPLGRIIERATRKLPAERYPNAQAMLADLERAAEVYTAATDPLAPPIQLVPVMSGPPPNAPTPMAQPMVVRPAPTSTGVVLLAIFGVGFTLLFVVAAGGMFLAQRARGPAPAPSFEARQGTEFAERAKSRLQSSGFRITTDQALATAPFVRLHVVNATDGERVAVISLVLVDERQPDVAYDSTFARQLKQHEAQDFRCQLASHRLFCLKVTTNTAVLDRATTNQLFEKLVK
jgi:serine/threonine protein kinase